MMPGAAPRAEAGVYLMSAIAEATTRIARKRVLISYASYIITWFHGSLERDAEICLPMFRQ
ncbi:MAG: hypothetical protein BGN84_08615 [Afipia sp. 62-7]|nr:MAG: hypothetical protein BGN84_08615 [Afipia sp. 62-7]